MRKRPCTAVQDRFSSGSGARKRAFYGYFPNFGSRNGPAGRPKAGFPKKRLDGYPEKLEERHRFLLDGGEELVGQAAHAEAEQALVQPFLPEKGGYDGVVAHGIHGGRDAAGGLEAHLATRLLIVLPDALAHHVGSHRRGVHFHLAGGRLDEIGPVLHSEEGSIGNEFRRHEESGLQDHLQDDGTAQLGRHLVDAGAAGGDFRSGFLIVPGQEGIEGEDDVDLVGPGPDGHLDLLKFHFDETLGGGETTGDRGHMDRRGASALAHDRGEIRVHAHRGGQRKLRMGSRKGVHLVHQLRHGCRRVLGTQRGQVHDGEAFLQDRVGNDLLQGGSNQFQVTGNRLLVRRIAILFE